mgnify:CR=1 FL=1
MCAISWALTSNDENPFLSMSTHMSSTSQRHTQKGQWYHVSQFRVTKSQFRLDQCLWSTYRVCICMYVGTHKVWDGLDTRAISVKVALTEFLRIWHECEFWWLWLRSPTPTPSQAPYPPLPSRSSPSLLYVPIPSHPIPAVSSFLPSFLLPALLRWLVERSDSLSVWGDSCNRRLRAM